MILRQKPPLLSKSGDRQIVDVVIFLKWTAIYEAPEQRTYYILEYIWSKWRFIFGIIIIIVFFFINISNIIILIIIIIILITKTILGSSWPSSSSLLPLPFTLVSIWINNHCKKHTLLFTVVLAGSCYITLPLLQFFLMHSQIHIKTIVFMFLWSSDPYCWCPPCGFGWHNIMEYYFSIVKKPRDCWPSNLYLRHRCSFCNSCNAIYMLRYMAHMTLLSILVQVMAWCRDSALNEVTADGLAPIQRQGICRHLDDVRRSQRHG